MSSFSTAHRLYVKSLYKRFLTNELDWAVNRQEWRARAMSVRAEFERNRFALPTVDETGFGVLTAWTETFTTLELWPQFFKKLRVTLPNIATQIAIFVSSTLTFPNPTLTCFRVSSSPVDAGWYKVVSGLRNAIICANSNLDFVQGT